MVDQDIVRKLLDYNPSTGLFTWRHRGSYPHSAGVARWNGRNAGKPAITYINAQGYKTGRLLGKPVRANRLAWLYVHGEWPDGEIDHIDHDKLNDRIDNLRCVSHRDNTRNMSRSSLNKTGATGVSLHKETGRYRVKVRNKHIGYYPDIPSAEAAAIAARAAMGFHENHGG